MHTPSSGTPSRANGTSSPNGQRNGAPNGRRRRPRQHAANAGHGTPSRPIADTAAPAAPAAPKASSPRPTAPLATDFVSLGVPAVLIDVLDKMGVVTPFPIQAATLPDALAGRDVLGRGKTGSGKTIAFALPTITRLAASRTPRTASRPRALVLVPTRELANQVAATMLPLARALSLNLTTVFGGVGQGPQVSALRNGVDIVIACPGRLEDLIKQGHCRLDKVEVTILDEADHMADLGFLPGVTRLLAATPMGTQRLLFSATLDNGIDVLVRKFLSSPVVHSVDPEVAPVSTMTHHVLAVLPEHKQGVIRHLASGMDRTLLFTRTKHGAKKLAKVLTASGIPSVELHGNLSQNARERNLEAFTDGTARVLVATDIAARGIHVDDIALVVHVDPPAEHKAYLHRSGRTARAGAEGVVITVMTPDQSSDIRALAKAAGIRPTVTAVEPGHALVDELVGPAAPHVTPSVVSVSVEQLRRPARANGQARQGQVRQGQPRQGSGGRAARSGSSAGRTSSSGSRPRGR